MPIIKADIMAGNTPMLLGMPGIGKSSFTEDLSKTMNAKVFTMPINQMADRADITGARIMKDESTGRYKQAFFPHAIIDDAIEYAEANPKELVVLFLDEINRATSDITSTVLAFITTRMCGTEKFPDNIRFVTAGNDKGNVVSLDDASLTRFIIYHVKPDIETFLSVQENLNPFIEESLRKFPADLLGTELQEVTAENEDDDSDEPTDFIEDFLDEAGGTFRQMTVPRTITYLSNFLNEIGINKSGTQEEMDVLKDFILDVSSENGSETNLLMSMLISHVGYTTFTDHLYQTISDYYQNILSQGISSGAASNNPVDKYRPQQDYINKLHYASAASEVEDIVESLNDNERKEAMLWSFSESARIDVDNNDAFNASVRSLTNFVPKFDQSQITDFTNMLLNGTKIDNEVLDIVNEEAKNGNDFCAGLTRIANTLTSALA